MADLVPASSARPASLLEPLTDPAGGSALERLRGFTAQRAVRKALPWFGGLAGVGMLALTWGVMAPAPQRVLYSQISDKERSEVVAALDQAAITYAIDNTTGALTVGEDDLYRARMVVAADGALAAPETGSEMLDSLPLGASRTLEGERLRAARERDITLTIMEIDGVEAVRVHLAEPEKSVFVRDNSPPTASVMVRMANGRQLSESQVTAIANLVAGSVPGLPIDSVRIADQHGRLLSERATGNLQRLELQENMEEKLRLQLDRLLTPMLGAGNFSSEIQVDLDMDEVTSARESYDKEGVIRRESESQSRVTSPAGTAVGVPGATSNTPPPATVAESRAPVGTAPATPVANSPVNDQTTTDKTFELGREVAVSNSMPGGIRRLSVAVALSEAAMNKAKPTEIAKLKELVTSAVGANVARGDAVTVIVRPFEPVVGEETPFYQTPWFAAILRQAVALIALLLVLLFAVRPLIRNLRASPEAEDDDEGEVPEGETHHRPARATIDQDTLNQQIDLLQQLVQQKPDRAVLALREMLEVPAKGRAT